ncbi:hypothetical protein Tco_0626289 [Tanacetum coccineum]|uniref:Uncharacterized protein n=1 Tax=Tanacetum coccineum TaxID=301880 RepID=A0ABQ4WJA1_9ASTR
MVQLAELSPTLFERYDKDIGELFTRLGAVSDDISTRDIDLGIVEERHVRLDLAEIVDSMRRGQEPRRDV